MAKLKYTDVISGVETFESSSNADGTTKAAELEGKYYGIYQISRSNQMTVLKLDTGKKAPVYGSYFNGLSFNTTVAVDLATRIDQGSKAAVPLSRSEQQLIWIIWHVIEVVHRLYLKDARAWADDVNIDGRRLAMSNINPIVASQTSDEIWDLICSFNTHNVNSPGYVKGATTHAQTVKANFLDANGDRIKGVSQSIYNAFLDSKQGLAHGNNGYAILLDYMIRHDQSGGLRLANPDPQVSEDWSVSTVDIYQTLAAQLDKLNNQINLFDVVDFGQKWLKKLFKVDVNVLDPAYTEDDTTLAYDTRILEGIYSYTPTIELTESTPDLPLYIGDIGFTTPPTAIRYNAAGQSYAFESLRTSSNPIVPVNTQRPSISVTLYIHGQDDINNKLRPLLAMAKRTPFTQIRSGVLYNMLVDRILAQELEETEDKSQVPIPIVIENLSFHTVPGYPDAIQIFLTLRFFNVFPYGMMYAYNPKTPDEISNTVDYKINEVLTHSRAFNPISAARKTYVSADGSRVSMPKATLPQSVTSRLHESPEFIHFYREQLADYIAPMSYVELPTRWPAYTPDGSPQTTLTYNRITKLNSPYIDGLEWVQGQRDEISKVTQMFEWLYNDKTGLKAYENAADPEPIRILFWETLTSLVNATQNIKTAVNTIGEEVQNRFDEVMDLETKSSNLLFVKHVVKNPFSDLDTNDEGALAELADVYQAAMGKAGEQNDAIGKYKPWLEGLIEEKSPVLDTLDLLMKDKIKRLFGSSETAPRTIALNSSTEPGIIDTERASVLTSMSISYGNKLVPIDILQYKTPTFQHTGIGQFGMSMIIQTNDPGMISTINDIRLTQAALSNPNEMGGGRDRIRIEDPLLSSFGLEYFTVRNTQIKTMAGATGWYEIAIDTLHNPKALHTAEDLRSLTTSAQGAVNRLVTSFFPSEINIKSLRNNEEVVARPATEGVEYYDTFGDFTTYGEAFHFTGVLSAMSRKHLLEVYQFTVGSSFSITTTQNSEQSIEITKALNEVLLPARTILKDWATSINNGPAFYNDMIETMAIRYLGFLARSTILWLAEQHIDTLPDPDLLDLTNTELSGVSVASAIALHTHRKSFMHTLFTNSQFQRQMKLAKAGTP
jgi:hypothetical protein